MVEGCACRAPDRQSDQTGMVSPGCAVAHSVTDIDGLVGDIDHLVATSGRVWVVETEYGWTPKRQFFRILSRLSGNVRAVKEWFGDGVPVVGCLVLASVDEREMGRFKRTYVVDHVTIEVYVSASIWRRIRDASTVKAGEGDQALANDLWRLSGMTVKESA